MTSTQEPNTMVAQSALCICPGGGGGNTPLFGLYGDVPLDRVWFLASLS